MPAHMSAQEAELKALTEACKLAEGKTVNIYTDSRYAFGITHDYGPIWRARAFLTANGHPFKHAEAVQQLMNALQLPTQAGIIKVKAHTKGTDGQTKGNTLVDQAAKKAASTPVASKVHHLDTPPSPLVSKDILARLQEQASKEEKNRWQKIGACSDTVTGLWGRGEKVCLPQVLYPMMAQVLHENVHHSKTAMCDTLQKQWIAPEFSTCAERQVQSCMICATHNQGRTVKTPSKHTPRPLYPFQRLQIDYIQLPRVGTYEYVLVCIDLFSGWPEAYPVAKATAKTTAKKLMAEIICRYGVPEVIESDRSSHFTGEIMSEVMAALGVSQALHTPYHPQSSGRVERLNGTFKLKIQKAMTETGKPWTECLPLALFSVGYTPNRKTGLSLYEILFGRGPNLECFFPQQLQLKYQDLTSYVQALHGHLAKVHLTVFSSLPDPDKDPGHHPFVPGDLVYVKKFVRRDCLQTRFEGPHTVILVTPTAVKLEGRPTWIHVSHWKLVKQTSSK
ncbi:protein NYNRIN-like [Ranitomeya variabilis]|uniref:protein NYNRIN-like n=1 Tax=Ranitomeya variabilis TaxID=490064 RepID=UPI0040569908